MPLSTNWQRIYICQGTPDPRANAVIYSTDDIEFWANQLKSYLAEGRRVAVMGEHAQAVVERYMQL